MRRRLPIPRPTSSRCAACSRCPGRATTTGVLARGRLQALARSRTTGCLAEIRQINMSVRLLRLLRGCTRNCWLAAHHVGRHRVARLMRGHGIRACRGRVRLRAAVRAAGAPPMKWSTWSAATSAPTCPTRCGSPTSPRSGPDQGWLYAAVILDAFNREVISWAVDDLDTPDTAIRAFDEAVPDPAATAGMHHPLRPRLPVHRQGLARLRRRASTSSCRSANASNPHDNAVIESWFASFKSEELYPRGQPATRAEARARLFDYIWAYNHHRRHSALGYVAPIIYATESSTCP